MKNKTLKYTTKILAIIITLFGLPFYFGYGNPLPFVNPDYTAWDNIWLSVFPLMFIGLILGLKWEKVGGFIITIPLLLGFILGFAVRGEITPHMLVPFVIGVMYLVVGYKSRYKQTKQ